MEAVAQETVKDRAEAKLKQNELSTHLNNQEIKEYVDKYREYIRNVADHLDALTKSAETPFVLAAEVTRWHTTATYHADRLSTLTTRCRELAQTQFLLNEVIEGE